MRKTFRLWLGGKFHYWGFVEGKTDLYFCGLPSTNVETLTMREMMERSQQSTGLRDKNGVEIFEGDVLKAYHPDERPYFIGYVVWDDDCTWFSLRTEICADIPLSEFDELERIGNIHENPELLEDTGRAQPSRTNP